MRQSVIANDKVTHPFTLALYDKGLTLRGLWRLSFKDNFEWNFKNFEAVVYGRLRNNEIERWIGEMGYGEELRQAQEKTGILNKLGKK